MTAPKETLYCAWHPEHGFCHTSISGAPDSCLPMMKSTAIYRREYELRDDPKGLLEWVKGWQIKRVKITEVEDGQ